MSTRRNRRGTDWGEGRLHFIWEWSGQNPWWWSALGIAIALLIVVLRLA